MNDHYQFHGAPGLPYKHEQQPLTPISNLTSHYQESPAQSHVLPPLHAPATAGGPSFNNTHAYRPPAPHTPRLPHTPDTPSSADQQSMHHPSNQVHISAAEPHTSYAPINHGFSAAPHAAGYVSHGGMPNGSTAQYPQVSLPQINAGSYSMDYRQQNGAPAYQYSQVSQQQQQQQQASQMSALQGADRRPMPVVGSQGRRGILPTNAGKAPPPGSQPDGTMRGGAQVNRNSENKFPCNYCNKTYLHLKHLKRHHLRHTGERPYQCGLCHETFCRSDILKRHFNKCSIRRGNPTGANHLTHAQDHLKNPQQQPLVAPSGAAMTQPRPSAISTAAPNPPSSFHQQWPGSARSFDGYTSQQMPSHHVGSTRSSRSSSVMRPESSSDDDNKKRFSSTSTLPTAAGTAETSPSASTQTFSFDRNGAHHQRDGSNGAFYPAQNATHNPAHMPAPVVTQQNEHLPSVNSYLRGGFTQYQHAPHEAMYQPPWTSAFQPGGSDQMMYTGH